MFQRERHGKICLKVYVCVLHIILNINQNLNILYFIVPHIHMNGRPAVVIILSLCNVSIICDIVDLIIEILIQIN